MSKVMLPTRLQERIDALMDMSRAEELPEKQTDALSLGVKIPPATTTEQPAVLPDISSVRRIVPNVMLRGSLFGVVGKGHRKYEKKSLKATINGLTIKFTGEQLDQVDLDVYLECIRRCGKRPLGEQVRFFAYDFLKSLRRDSGKSQYELLKDSLLRLTACVVEIGDGRYFYMGHIVNDNYRDENTGEFIISMNPKIAAFYSTEMWTGLSLEERHFLKGKPLAQWLHGFYCTHAKPHPYKVETLKDLCGSRVSLLKKFRQMLNRSLEDVSEATGWKCWIDDNDLVNVKKK